MASRTRADPRREFLGDCAVVRALTDIPKRLRDRTPASSVPDSRTSERVRNFMQKNLVDFVILIPAREITRHRDALLVEVAEPGPGLRVVKAERPDGGVEMKRNERLRPRSHPVQISHETTLSGSPWFALTGAQIVDKTTSNVDR
jgi:hypothetical protein